MYIWRAFKNRQVQAYSTVRPQIQIDEHKCSKINQQVREVRLMDKVSAVYGIARIGKHVSYECWEDEQQNDEMNDESGDGVCSMKWIWQ